MRPLIVLSVSVEQIAPVEVADTSMPIGSMVLDHNSLGKMANAMTTLNKMQPLHAHEHAPLSFAPVVDIRKTGFYIFVLRCLSHCCDLCAPPGWVGISGGDIDSFALAAEPFSGWV